MRFGSASSAPAKSVPQSLPAFYEWRIPGQPFSIQLAYELIDRLQADVMKGFWAVPKRGAEIGGLLVGRVVASSSLTNGEATVFIEDYEPVSCEHRRGPSYVLSEADRKRLERAIRRNGRDRQVVGYFRSHTRPGLYLDEDDMSLVRSYFSNPTDVVVLVRPSASRPSVAGFFFWEDDDMRRHSTYREFTFSREELQKPLLGELGVDAVVEEDAAPALAPAAPARPPVEVVAMTSPPPRGRPPIRFPQRWRPLAYAAALLAGLGLMEYQILGLVQSRAGTGPKPRAATLRVERNGEYLQVSWDRESPVVAKADRGVLLILDGQYRKEIELDSAHLRSGMIAYAPSGNDVSFRLELDAGGRTMTEAVRVVTAPPPGAPAGEYVAASAPPAAPKKALETAIKSKPRARPRWYDDGL